ncbi:MAG: TetR/AcrR family transcriptional regulator [Rhodocyclales bacterium]|nr:TetR/AcrR family transcriptional regulator [Rhodocyclales bacterium]
MSEPLPKPNPESDCRRRLIEAAHEAFRRDGFRGASVDRIAAAAGVAKQTFYNHFPSKEALFEETIRLGVREIVVELNDAPGDVRKRLIAFSLAFRRKLLSPEGLDWYRTAIADLSRLPELGCIVWRQGPLQTLQYLADFLSAAMDRGELRHDDPMFAAEMLNGMLINLDRTRGLLAGDFVPGADPEKVERIVACFLRAYQPQ